MMMSFGYKELARIQRLRVQRLRRPQMALLFLQEQVLIEIFQDPFTIVSPMRNRTAMTNYFNPMTVNSSRNTGSKFCDAYVGRGLSLSLEVNFR